MSIFCPFREEKRANSRNHNYMLNNPFHFCRILRIPYQALKLLQICGSTTCLPAVQLLLQMWLGWSMTLLLSACLVLKCKHNSLSKLLSSPRAKRASPKGERASRARAVTVSQCPPVDACYMEDLSILMLRLSDSWILRLFGLCWKICSNSWIL